MGVSMDTTKLYKAFKVENFKEMTRPVGLDKWPACLVTGIKIDPDVASEFIRRTDKFFKWNYGGNRIEWCQRVREITGMNLELKWDHKMTDEEREERKCKEAFFRRQWMSLKNIYYLATGRVSDCYIAGYHGVVDFDGNIYWWQNIGKWPSLSEVVAELESFGYAFPCLELRATLFNGEYCEKRIKPLVSLWLKNGKVTVTEPVPEKIRKLPAERFSCFDPDGGETDPHITEDKLREWAKMAGTYTGK